MYVETLKERAEETARNLAETDSKLHTAEEERDDARTQLRYKEREVTSMSAEVTRLLRENAQMREDKHRLEDDAKVREERVGQLMSALERSRDRRARFMEAYMKTRSLATGAV